MASICYRASFGLLARLTDDQSMSEKDHFIRRDRFGSDAGPQALHRDVRGLALTLPNLGEFPLRPGVASTGLLRQSGTCRCQLHILVVVAATQKILSLRQRLQ